MPRNIVLCLDGTWNGPDAKEDGPGGGSTPTNVQKLFESLKGSAPLAATQDECEIRWPDGEADGAQAAKYIHGVGDCRNALAKACEGATGLGLVARIVRGYTYLSREYRPGDRLHLVGFSRGAYTARALAGLVTGQGLLDWDAMKLVAGSDESYSAGLAAWRRHKAASHPGDTGLLGQLAGVVSDLHDRFDMGLHPAPELQFVDDVPVQSVGVWDTVGALGIPDIEDSDGTCVRRDVFQFCNTALGPRVAHGFHAVAVDEQRVDFTPTLWDDRDGVVQVLFPGAHADVGGGYPAAQSGLSNGALAWMARQLASVGVLFTGMPAGLPDPLGMQHEPWLGGMALYRRGARHFPPGLRLSQRVLQRMAAEAVPVEKVAPPGAAYRPANLVNSYVMLDASGAAPHVLVEP